MKISFVMTLITSWMKGENRLRKWMAWGLFVLASLLGFCSEAEAKEVGCHSFANWSESQKYFEEKGGSKYQNRDGLDSDSDGLACEELIGYDPKHINPNNEKPEDSTANHATEKSAWDKMLSVILDWWQKWFG